MELSGERELHDGCQRSESIDWSRGGRRRARGEPSRWLNSFVCYSPPHHKNSRRPPFTWAGKQISILSWKHCSSQSHQPPSSCGRYSLFHPVWRSVFDNTEKKRGGSEDEEEEVEEERGKCFSSDERCFNFSFPQGVSAHDWRGDR